MSRQAEVVKLDARLDALKTKLDGTDITTLDSEESVEKYLTEIADAYVQIKQFISRFGENRWTDWGPARWVYIERSKVALESRLTTLRRDSDRKTRRYQKITMTISVIAAVAAAYFAYK
jgi:hypothetical protein